MKERPATWKRNSENSGRFYTKGLFIYSRIIYILYAYKLFWRQRFILIDRFRKGKVSCIEAVTDRFNMLLCS